MYTDCRGLKCRHSIEHPRTTTEAEILALHRVVEVLGGRLHMSHEALQDLIHSHVEAISSGESSPGEDAHSHEEPPDSPSEASAARRDSVHGQVLAGDMGAPAFGTTPSPQESSLGLPNVASQAQASPTIFETTPRVSEPIGPIAKAGGLSPAPQPSSLLSPPYSYNIFSATSNDYFALQSLQSPEELSKPAQAFGSLFTASSFSPASDAPSLSTALGNFGSTVWPSTNGINNSMPAPEAASQSGSWSSGCGWNPTGLNSAWHWSAPVASTF